jgi:hypothetical protein
LGRRGAVVRRRISLRDDKEHGASTKQLRFHSPALLSGLRHTRMMIMQFCSVKMSRRKLLKGVACASASAALVAAAEGPVAAKGKRSKADVAYQDSPHGHERCEICAPFLPPDQCRTVAGSVARQGWCKIYEGA